MVYGQKCSDRYYIIVIVANLKDGTAALSAVGWYNSRMVLPVLIAANAEVISGEGGSEIAEKTSPSKGE